MILAQSLTAQEIRVMTYNIRYDNPDDPYKWSQRKELIASQVLFQEADVVGFQEALNHQNKDLQALLPEYSWTGVGRDDGKEKGEYCSIFYRKEAYELLGSGTIALSETPDIIGSRSWDAALQRICSWVELKDKKSNLHFFVFNTHFDHQGEIARQKSAELLGKKIPEIAKNQAFVLLGDFNCDPLSEPFKVLSSVFNESAAKAMHKHGFPSTYNGWTYQNENPVIDHIFFSNHLKINYYTILAEHFNGAFASDHYPVISQLSIKK